MRCFYNRLKNKALLSLLCFFFPFVFPKKVRLNTPIDYKTPHEKAHLQGFFLFLGSRRVAKDINTPTISHLFSLNKQNGASVSLHPHRNQKYSWLIESRCKGTNYFWYSISLRLYLSVPAVIYPPCRFLCGLLVSYSHQYYIFACSGYHCLLSGRL